MHSEPGLYPIIIDIVVAMNDTVRKRIGAQKHEYKGNHKSIDKITPKSHSFTRGSNTLTIQCADLSHFFGCDLEQKNRGCNEWKTCTLSSVFLQPHKITKIFKDFIETKYSR